MPTYLFECVEDRGEFTDHSVKEILTVEMPTLADAFTYLEFKNRFRFPKRAPIEVRWLKENSPCESSP